MIKTLKAQCMREFLFQVSPCYGAPLLFCFYFSSHKVRIFWLAPGQVKETCLSSNCQNNESFLITTLLNFNSGGSRKLQRRLF